MKTLKYLLLLFALISFTKLSKAQIVENKIRHEIGVGGILQENKRLKATYGFWITPKIVAHLSSLTGGLKVRFSGPEYNTRFNPSNPIDARFESSMEMRNKIVLNCRVYQKPKAGFFGGLGITRHRYLITHKSNFKDENSGYIGGGSSYTIRHRVETSDKTWGINSQLGYAYRLKNARFEFILRYDNPILKDREYEFNISNTFDEFKTASIKSDFAYFPLGIEMSYIIDLF